MYLPDGRYLQFADANNGWGLYASDDNYVLNQLDECIARRRGGIEEIMEAEYEEVKKKPVTNSLEQHFREVIDARRLSLMLRQLQENVENAVADEPFETWRPYTSKDYAKGSPKADYRPKAVAR